jgi:hypothetical protein
VTLPFSVSIAYGRETPSPVGSFEDYQVARAAAIRRIGLKTSLRQPTYAMVKAGEVIVFEASRLEDGSVAIDREVMG